MPPACGVIDDWALYDPAFDQRGARAEGHAGCKAPGALQKCGLRISHESDAKAGDDQVTGPPAEKISSDP